MCVNDCCSFRWSEIPRRGRHAREGALGDLVADVGDGGLDPVSGGGRVHGGLADLGHLGGHVRRRLVVAADAKLPVFQVQRLAEHVHICLQQPNPSPQHDPGCSYSTWTLGFRDTYLSTTTLLFPMRKYDDLEIREYWCMNTTP